jgi:glycosyltransferase involved in cell wall biosynthesis
MTDKQLTELNYICFYLPRFGEGGVERMMTNLANDLAQLGIRVDFIVSEKFKSGPYTISDSVNLVKLPPKGNKAVKALTSYIDTHKPELVMSIKEPADFIALKAKLNVKNQTKFVVRIPTAIKARATERKANIFRDLFKKWKMKRHYRHADGFIAVAEGTKQDFHAYFPQIKADILVVNNPVVTEQLLQQQDEAIDHPWFEQNELPLIMGMGGFRQQKDFATLIRAFALVRKQRECRLLIVGQGKRQEQYEQLCNELKIIDDVCFPGFAKNPYPWLKKADVFVLSSLWEGSPNALTEALAVGTPVVSTDCLSGPKEILQNGRYGKLVAMRDHKVMATAIIETLDNPLPKDKLREATNAYTVEASRNAYLQAFNHFLTQ